MMAKSLQVMTAEIPIPFELNDREVEMVDCENNEFHIYLECE